MCKRHEKLSFFDKLIINHVPINVDCGCPIIVGPLYTVIFSANLKYFKQFNSDVVKCYQLKLKFHFPTTTAKRGTNLEFLKTPKQFPFNLD